jgi:pantoate--beta-alanine ligase
VQVVTTIQQYLSLNLKQDLLKKNLEMRLEMEKPSSGVTAKPEDNSLALVPTMGALHNGHCALITLAKQQCQQVVVSIFVNPLQFSPTEDFSRYPRPLEQDLAVCQAMGVDVVFVPGIQDMCGAGGDSVSTTHQQETTRIVPPDYLTGQLCGLNRPGHFEGVATIVLKLLHIIQPQVAIFGEKDAQQLSVIRQMVADLNVPVSIVGHPVVREASGLALSSRNQYLHTAEEQGAALFLIETLHAVKKQFKNNLNQSFSTQHLTEVGQTQLGLYQQRYPSVKLVLHYLEAVDNETFRPVEPLTGNTRILIAATVNTVRLIDNLSLSED